eukprot:TRINITY_DN1596_c0_g1_i2.p1 TRINITY_DN1596_c0_g1~~TRINITY_DN1596_c0_g1_i2.p1  ORF type:complete len:175 (-),score=50.77 TRINITY_DN1596_c0_g1_i2:90-614(-)
MDPEKDSFVKMDESLKRKNIFEKLFNDLENLTVGSSDLEKLPKLILCNIFKFLSERDLGKIFRLNKYLFKFLWSSPSSGPLWEKMIIYQQEGLPVDERIVEQFVMNPMLDKFEQKMTRYLLYFKNLNNFEWDSTFLKYQIVNKKKAIYLVENTTSSIPSKYIFKGQRKFELIYV